MSEGWVIIHRQIEDNRWWLHEPFSHGQAWIDLILLANHKPGWLWVRGVKVELKRGDVGWSMLALSKRWKWSNHKVKRFFVDLESDGQIVPKTSNRISSIISIKNYDLYQSVSNRRPTDVQQTSTNNNGNNVNNENNTVPNGTSPSIKITSRGKTEEYSVEDL